MRWRELDIVLPHIAICGIIDWVDIIGEVVCFALQKCDFSYADTGDWVRNSRQWKGVQIDVAEVKITLKDDGCYFIESIYGSSLLAVIQPFWARTSVEESNCHQVCPDCPRVIDLN